MSEIARLLVQQGRDAADARRQAGALWGNAVQNVSQAPGQIIAQQEADRLRNQQLEIQRNRDSREQMGANDAHEAHALQLDQMRQHAATDWADRLIASNMVEPEQVAAEVDRQTGKLWKPEEAAAIKARIVTPEGTRQFLQGIASLPKAHEPKVQGVNPEEDVYVDGVLTKKGTPKVVPPEKPKAVTFGEPHTVMIGGKRVQIRAGSDGLMYDLDGKKVPGSIISPDNPPKDENNEPLVAIMKDGKPVLVRRRDAINQTPASIREQGRPVISGDANRLSDLATAIKEAEVLNGAITDPGTLSKIQSAMPDFVNNIVGGWGNDAKAQNAIIARVRQIIGKGLEGGVLRKEDEVKYKEMLPSIGESKELVTTKITTMKAALDRKRAELLDSLQDAGYDVSAFRKREAAKPKEDAKAPTAGFIEAFDKDGNIHYAAAGTPLPAGWKLK